MSFEFQYSGPPEYSAAIPFTPLTIYVSKSGGGDLSRAWEGHWDTALLRGTRILECSEYTANGQDAMYSGTPQSHAAMAKNFAGWAGQHVTSLTSKEIAALGEYADDIS